MFDENKKKGQKKEHVAVSRPQDLLGTVQAPLTWWVDGWVRRLCARVHTGVIFERTEQHFVNAIKKLETKANFAIY